MGELSIFVDLYPKAKRDIQARRAFLGRSPENRAIAKQYGKEYFDGTREQGYGGFYYDGRWRPIVKKMTQIYALHSKSSVLDVGCAKGFMLHDFKESLPGMTVAGIDISSYAMEHAMETVKPYLRLGNATTLPYPDRFFDLVVAINVLHNLPEDLCRQALREIIRVGRRHSYIQVDSFRNPQEKENLENWQLTAELIYDTNQWKKIFREEDYRGDYYWTITE